MARPAGMSSESENEDDFEFGTSFSSSFHERPTHRGEQYDSICSKIGIGIRTTDDRSHKISNQASSHGSPNGYHSNGLHTVSKNVTNGITASLHSPQNHADQNDGSGFTSRENSFQSSGRKSPSPSYSIASNASSTNSSRISSSLKQRNSRYLPLDDLRMALVQGNLAVIKSIMCQGVSVDQILKGGWTPLMFAASRGHYEIVQCLLQKGADPNIHKEMFTALMAACASTRESEGDLRCVEGLLSFGAEVDVCERHRMTALMFAAKEGKSEVVDRLIKAEAVVDKQDNKGWTALSWAATKGNGKVARKLLEASSDPKKANVHGQTPADIALAAGHSQLADILSRACYSGDAKNELPSEFSDSPKKSDSSKADDKFIHVGRCSEIEMVLSGLDLSDLIPLFQTHKISLECFLRLNDADLEKIGVSALGTRKNLLETIAQIHKQEWKTSSLPNLSKLPYITLPDSVAMIKNVNKHLRFIHASIGHLRDQIQATPRILELGQEKHNVATLSNLFGDSLKNISHLEEEVKFFKAHLEQVCENSQDLTSADTIVTRSEDGRSWQRHLMTSLVAVTSLAAVLYWAKPKAFGGLLGVATGKTMLLQVP